MRKTFLISFLTLSFIQAMEQEQNSREIFTQISNALNNYRFQNSDTIVKNFQKFLKNKNISIDEISDLAQEYPALSMAFMDFQYQDDLRKVFSSHEELLKSFTTLKRKNATKVQYFLKNCIREELDKLKQKIESEKDINGKATKIQSVWKGKKARDSFKRLKEEDQENLAQNYRKDSAAKKIQKKWRNKKENERLYAERLYVTANNLIDSVRNIYKQNQFEHFIRQNLSLLEEANYTSFPASLFGAWLLMCISGDQEKLIELTTKKQLLHEFTSLLMENKNSNDWEKLFGTLLWEAIKEEQKPIMDSFDKETNAANKIQNFWRKKYPKKKEVALKKF